MRVILPNDPRWGATFPHLVTPYSDLDEWVVGLMLRCDEINNWYAGTTAAYIAPHETGPESFNVQPSVFINGATLNLPYLAEVLALDPPDVFQTTFRPGLIRLFGDESNNPKRFGPRAPFRVCPLCVAESRLLTLSSAMPLVHSCLRHEKPILFQAMCRCGSPLRPFGQHLTPFTCDVCGLPWDDLPIEHVSQKTAESDGHALQLFHAFLKHETPLPLSDAIHLIQCEMRARAMTALPPLESWYHPLPTSFRVKDGYSLVTIVATLVALDIPATCIVQSRRGVDLAHMSCLNRACPLFGIVGQGNIRRPAFRENRYETYCTECGSCFFGERIYMSFDDSPGANSNGPHPASAKRARQDLDRWRVSLDETCRRMREAGTPISLVEAFRGAGVPLAPRLRARRLGLVALVNHHAALQRGLEGDQVASSKPNYRKYLTRQKRHLAGNRHRENREYEWHKQRTKRTHYATDLTDEQWERVKPLVPQERTGDGRRAYDRRDVIDAIRYVLMNGCSWREIPADLPEMSVVHHLYTQWRRAGTWQRVAAVLSTDARDEGSTTALLEDRLPGHHLRLAAHLDVDAIKQQLRHQTDSIARVRWQVILLLAEGRTPREVATMTDRTVEWVRSVAGRYNAVGPAALDVGQPGRRPLLNDHLHRELVTALRGPAPDGGELWTGRMVAEWMERKTGHPVVPERGWLYLTRLGFTARNARNTSSSDVEATSLADESI